MPFPDYALLVHAPYRVQREPAVIATEMESGPPKQTRVRSRAMVRRQVRYAFASAQNYFDFIDWFNGPECQAGAAWFDWRDPVDDQVKQARITGGVIEEELPNKQMDKWLLKFTIETWG